MLPAQLDGASRDGPLKVAGRCAVVTFAVRAGGEADDVAAEDVAVKRPRIWLTDSTGMSRHRLSVTQVRAKRLLPFGDATRQRTTAPHMPVYARATGKGAVKSGHGPHFESMGAHCRMASASALSCGAQCTSAERSRSSSVSVGSNGAAASVRI